MNENDNIREGCLHGIYTIAVFFIVLLLCACFGGCRCPECATTTETEKIVKVVERDTTIVTAADSAQVKLLLRCDSANNVLIDEICARDGERLRMQLQLQALATGSVAYIDCREDSLLTEIHMRDSIIATTTTNTKIIREKYVPGYYKFVSWGFWILLAVLILLGAWKILKAYLKKSII